MANKKNKQNKQNKNQNINGISKKDNKSYDQMVKKSMPKSNLVTDCGKAFWVGGTICAIGEIIRQILLANVTEDKIMAGTITSIILVTVAAILTAFGVYEKLGHYAGAGSIVPITGFANSIVSPAIEFKTEGYVTGTGVKMFEVAGPVLVFGISTSALAGLVIWVCQTFHWCGM